jgi:hypothetical protein
MDEKQQEVYHNVLVDVFLLLINNTRNVQWDASEFIWQT